MSIINSASMSASIEHANERVFSRPDAVPEKEPTTMEEALNMTSVQEEKPREFHRPKQEYQKPVFYPHNSCYDICGVDGCGNKACSNYHKGYKNK